MIRKLLIDYNRNKINNLNKNLKNNAKINILGSSNYANSTLIPLLHKEHVQFENLFRQLELKLLLLEKNLNLKNFY